MIDRDKPPTFPSGLKRRGADAYPMGGKKTAPAWRAMWHELVDAGGDWVPGVRLDELGAAAGRCSEWTAKLLLHRAADAGVIEKDKTVVGGRWQVRYRVRELAATEKVWVRVEEPEIQLHPVMGESDDA